MALFGDLGEGYWIDINTFSLPPLAAAKRRRGITLGQASIIVRYFDRMPKLPTGRWEFHCVGVSSSRSMIVYWRGHVGHNIPPVVFQRWDNTYVATVWDVQIAANGSRIFRQEFERLVELRLWISLYMGRLMPHSWFLNRRLPAGPYTDRRPAAITPLMRITDPK